MSLSLAERDLHLLQIEQEIRNKKNLLVKKKKDLDKKHKLNHYLTGVKKDYSKYYDFILNEKQQQLTLKKIHYIIIIKQIQITKKKIII